LTTWHCILSAELTKTDFYYKIREFLASQLKLEEAWWKQND